MKRTLLALALATGLISFPGNAKAEFLYVSNREGTVGKYDATTGAAINTSFITGLFLPSGLALSGNDLFVAELGNSAIGKYDATTGAAINASFITGLNNPDSIALFGNNLFVANQGSDVIGKYDATTGAAIDASFITGAGGGPIAISGNDLFVSDYVDGIGKYNAATGAVIDELFITGLGAPWGVAISGDDLFVSNFSGDTVGKYDATTGAAINDSFIIELNRPSGIAIGVVPEPSTYALLLLSGAASLWALRRRNAKQLAKTSASYLQG